MIKPTAAPGSSPNEIAIDAARSGAGGRITALVSALALAFSGYSLWDSSLKAPDIKVFVPPQAQYGSPYQNSNFEVFAIPMTLLNDGGRSGTILSIGLEATSVKTGETKRFISSEFGRWSAERNRASASQPFAPIALAGKASRTETVLFFPRSDEEKPLQIVGTERGQYRFRLVLDEAEVDDLGPLDRLWKRGPTAVSFEMELRYYDARAFTSGSGTLPLHSTTGRSAKSSDAAAGK